MADHWWHTQQNAEGEFYSFLTSFFTYNYHLYYIVLILTDMEIKDIARQVDLLVKNQLVEIKNRSNIKRFKNDLLMKAKLIEKFNAIFRQVNEDLIGNICDQFLGLPEGTKSCVDDIVRCRIYFESATEYLSTSTDQFPFENTGYLFYKEFLDD
jgi:hypothetical protein